MSRLDVAPTTYRALAHQLSDFTADYFESLPPSFFSP